MNEAELLFTDILNCNRLSLYLDRDTVLDKDKSVFISAVFKKRILGEPLQYILGKTEFMGMEFKVTPDVFIPRPETEILVEATVSLVSCVMCHVSCVNILDLGTGSGCIAVSLARFLKNVSITAVDISNEALEIAKENAQLNNVTDKIKFIYSDLFTNYELRITNYDIIISNPPYIPRGEIAGLQPELQYEPRIALDGGKDGLDFYRRIIDKAPDYLKKEGFLILEMGFNQKGAVKNIFQKSGVFQIIELIKDYNNIHRAVIAKKRE